MANTEGVKDWIAHAWQCPQCFHRTDLCDTGYQLRDRAFATLYRKGQPPRLALDEEGYDVA